MRSRGVRRVGGGLALIGLVVAGLLTAGVLGSTAPAATSQQRVSAAAGSIHLRFNVNRVQLNRSRDGLVAHGTAVATYSSGGVNGTSTQRLTLAVGQNSSCRVLHLELGELRLNLLGLLVSLTPVDDPNIVIDISADSSESLGKLLCQLIQSLQSSGSSPSTTAAKTAAARRVNAALHKHSDDGAISFNVPLKQAQASPQATTGTAGTTTTGTTTGTAAQSGQCEVLNLLLGPLNLDLLGLVVTVNKIDLDISATPVGTLGTLFCQLAGTTSAPTVTIPTVT
jgi:hypothetical protein